MEGNAWKGLMVVLLAFWELSRVWFWVDGLKCLMKLASQNQAYQAQEHFVRTVHGPRFTDNGTTALSKTSKYGIKKEIKRTRKYR